MNNVIIIAYDISSNKVRTKFSKFLEKYGVRVQFSVFEVKNSKRVLDIVLYQIENKFQKLFESGDSIYIFRADHKETIRYGSAQLVDQDLILI
ncbi:MAG: CRISPR-associated endonuclease Cas2 [Flavobacteriales bacterium]